MVPKYEYWPGPARRETHASTERRSLTCPPLRSTFPASCKPGIVAADAATPPSATDVRGEAMCDDPPGRDDDLERRLAQLADELDPPPASVLDDPRAAFSTRPRVTTRLKTQIAQTPSRRWPSTGAP